jgi:hypothetical protein
MPNIPPPPSGVIVFLSMLVGALTFVAYEDADKPHQHRQ